LPKPTRKRRSPPPEEAAVFGQNVKAARERYGITQTRLAKDAEIIPSKMPAIEAGNTDVHLSTMAKLARALGLTVHKLLVPKIPRNKG
jgi:DNA-binding XRE family transcriptional regulator